MRYWTTRIRAICPIQKEMVEWVGPHVPGFTKRHAEEYCQKNGLGYCEVDGELVAEIPCDENYKAQWDKMIDYHAAKYN